MLTLTLALVCDASGCHHTIRRAVDIESSRPERGVLALIAESSRAGWKHLRRGVGEPRNLCPACAAARAAAKAAKGGVS